MKTRWMNILRVLISTGALAFLFWKIGLGETVTVLRKADLRYWVPALALYSLSLVIRAYRWFTLIRGLDLSVPFGRVVRLYFVGAFFSAFLPTQFGGDVVRALELTQDTDSSAAVGTVLLDRMTGLMVLFAMGLVVLPFHAARMAGWLVVLLIGVAGSGLIAGILVLEGHLLRRLSERLPAILSLEGQGPLARVYAAVTGCGWRAVTGALGVSVAFNLTNVLVNWLCGKTVGASINLGYFFAVTSLLSVSGLIPSIGGWGVREATSTAIFAPTGTDENTAAALGVALGAINLTVGLLGAIVYGIEAIRGLRAND
jgi:uncharacterized membrane protein YbhN (UPF0104 family)